MIIRSRWIPSLLALTVLVTACSKGAPTGSAPKPADPVKAKEPGKVVEIRVGKFTNEPSLDPVIAAFQDKYPNYRVEQVPLGMPVESLEKLKNGVVDVVSDAHTLGLMLAESPILNLDPYIAKSRLDLAPYGKLLEAHRVNGHIYGLPAWTEPYLFAYSKPFAEAAKVTIPPASWTWDEFRTAAARLAHDTDNGRVWGFDSNSIGEDLAYMLAVQKTPAGGVPDEKTYREVLQFFGTMVQTDRTMAPVRPWAAGEYRAPCYNNQAAMCLLILSTLRQNKLFADFAIAPFPAAEQNRPTAVAMSRSYTILAKSPEPDAAWDFISFVSGPEGQTIMARQGYFPAYFSDATKQAWLESNPPPPAGAKSLLNATMYPLPRSFEMSSDYEAFVQGANKVLSGAGTIDEAVAAYAKVLPKQKN